MTPYSPFIIASTVAAESSGVAEVFSVIASAAIALFAFYKLGTVESLIKTAASVVLFIAGLYAAGYVFPSIQETGWYQLVAWIIETGPGIILEQLGGRTG